jgi:hypothetical protein
VRRVTVGEAVAGIPGVTVSGEAVIWTSLCSRGLGAAGVAVPTALPSSAELMTLTSP